MIQTERSIMQRLKREGIPIAEIARRLGRSRQTLYNWRKEKDSPPAWKRPGKLDPFKLFIESRLEKYDLPGTVLLRELREQGYKGGISILREFIAPIKDGFVRRVVDRFETEPGRQAQVDWASCGLIQYEGRRRRLSLLVVVLGYSRVIWGRFVVSERRPVLMKLLEEAFKELGGVPKELLFDNLKQVVAQVRTSDSPAQIQPGFTAFAEHWGFETLACPPYWPRAKGKVERAIEYIETSFLEGRSFTDLDDLNAQLRIWLAETANVRLHGTTKQRPVDRLAADQQAMLPIACRPSFPCVEVRTQKVYPDAMISYGGVKYSVDPSILGGRRDTRVEIRIGTDEHLRAYHDSNLVADHPIAPKGSPPQEDPLHAAARRALRQRPSKGRPKGNGPRFEQRTALIGDLLPGAPEVAARPLSTYEAIP